MCKTQLWVMIHTLRTSYCCELLLEKADTLAIYKCMGQLIINFNHAENGTAEQCALSSHFAAMIVVSSWRGRIGILEISRKKLLEGWMTVPKILL